MQIKLIRQAIANKTLRTIPTGLEKLVPLNGRNCILASATDYLSILKIIVFLSIMLELHNVSTYRKLVQFEKN